MQRPQLWKWVAVLMTLSCLFPAKDTFGDSVISPHLPHPSPSRPIQIPADKSGRGNTDARLAERNKLHFENIQTKANANDSGRRQDRDPVNDKSATDRAAIVADSSSTGGAINCSNYTVSSLRVKVDFATTILENGEYFV